MRKVVALLLLAGVVSLSSAQLVNVVTPLGTITGYHVDYGTNKSAFYYGKADVFLGIPYAQPPVGKLRFQKPVPLRKLPLSLSHLSGLNTAYNATYFRPACPQRDTTNSFAQSEDCLQLNIFTPNAASHAKLPVAIWIHGGNMKSGKASEYPPEGITRNFASRGVVVVTLQYRLGLLGFFTTFTDDFPPNVGLLDQVEAIRWVKNNIQYFGGDPYRITLVGHSSGGASVSAHTLSPISQNLFQQAVLQSGTVLTCFRGALGFDTLSRSRAASLCNFTSSHWQAGNFAQLKKCLLNKQPADWLPAEASNTLGWKMVQDNYFLPGTPDQLALTRPNIPILIGSMHDEWAAVDMGLMAAGTVTPQTFSKAYMQYEFSLYGTFLNVAPVNALDLYLSVYLPKGTAANDWQTWLRVNSDVFTMAAFTGFIGREIRSILQQGNQEVYVYEMTFITDIYRFYQIPGTTWKPVTHTTEIAFLFAQQTWWNLATAQGLVRDVDRQVLDHFADWWTHFIKFGRPTYDTNEWEPSRLDYLRYFEIGGDSSANRMRDRYRETDHAVFGQITQHLVGPLPPDCPSYNNGTLGCPQQ